jgi:hypothetical protein
MTIPAKNIAMTSPKGGNRKIKNAVITPAMETPFGFVLISHLFYRIKQKEIP